MDLNADPIEITLSQSMDSVIGVNEDEVSVRGSQVVHPLCLEERATSACLMLSENFDPERRSSKQFHLLLRDQHHTLMLTQLHPRIPFVRLSSDSSSVPPFDLRSDIRVLASRCSVDSILCRPFFSQLASCGGM